MRIEQSDADVAELESAEPAENGEALGADPEELPTEADPADVVEQRLVVPDDDDYDR